MNLLDIATIVTAFLPYIIFTVSIVKFNAKQNGASYVLWTVLDSIMLACVYFQHKNITLYSTITIGTAMVMLTLLIKKQFEYKLFEFFITILIGICLFVFFKSGLYFATIATTVAVNLAAIPQIIDTWKKPKETPTIGYLLLATSGVLSAIKADAWTVPDRLPSINCAIFCFGIALLSMRRKKPFYTT
jgi:hypothetical protein